MFQVYGAIMRRNGVSLDALRKAFSQYSNFYMQTIPDTLSEKRRVFFKFIAYKSKKVTFCPLINIPVHLSI